MLVPEHEHESASRWNTMSEGAERLNISPSRSMSHGISTKARADGSRDLTMHS
jgi:hypothetical protein